MDARRSIVRELVSIHALVRRATNFRILGPPLNEFQSTPSYGGRQHPLQRRSQPLAVSIHALVRRATRSRSASLTCTWTFQSTPSYGGRPDQTMGASATVCFNPRPRTEGDREQIACTAGRHLFQSTPSYGGRRFSPKTFRSRPICFNPRPRTEGDDKPVLVPMPVLVSIHALVRRATLFVRTSTKLPNRFNPRPRTEGDAVDELRAREVEVSIHALVRRATQLREAAYRVAEWFQSTPSYGGRRWCDQGRRPGNTVSIHALVRRATSLRAAS